MRELRRLLCEAELSKTRGRPVVTDDNGASHDLPRLLMAPLAPWNRYDLGKISIDDLEADDKEKILEVAILTQKKLVTLINQLKKNLN